MMKVLFLAACSQRVNLYSNASVRYRCYNPAEDLNAMGLLANVCHVADFCESWVDCYDAFIFHRPTSNKDCIKAIHLLKENNKSIIADYDDLLFGRENALSSPAFINGDASKRLVISANRSYTQALLNFDYFTVSTEPLADYIKKIKPSAICSVVHNGVSRRWFDLAGEVALKKNSTIGYFAGGSFHNHDFSGISLVLASFLNRNGDTQLLIPETLTPPSMLVETHQLAYFKNKHFYNLPGTMAQCSVHIAPLVCNEFNRCKSAIKFLESAAVGIPLIATPIPDFQRFHSQGLLFAKSLENWEEHLDTLLSCGASQQDELREYVLSTGMSFPQSMKLASFLEEVIKG